MTLEEIEQKIEEDTFYAPLEKAWEESLPADTSACFPISTQKFYLHQSINNLLGEIRTYKNKLALARPPDDWWFARIIEDLGVELDRQSRKLRWLNTPDKADKGLDIEKAKAVPITQLVEFKRNVAKCVWHNERSPSMHYYKNKNKVYCFGCQKGGDVIDVAMAIWKCDIKEAINKLN
jgi:hypothetical protein